MHDYPKHEIERSPAASAVGRLASASALGLFHFEHRARLETPEIWLPPGRADLSTAPSWSSGVLPESKYQGFRHDLLIGSFHPGHRAKWTAHELCHGLVGFAWRPDATPFFLAVAARLAEALPVGLWYYLDEAGLRRCPRHAGGGALYGAYCAACEASAATGMDLSASDRAWSTLGAGFVEREVDAAIRSAQEGEMISHRIGSLDLASDGVAYAGAHARRLSSPEFARYAADFFRPGEGLHEDLDALAHRVREVLEGVVEGSEVTPLAGDASARIAQDVGWRLLTLKAEMDGEAGERLDGLIDHLAEHRDSAAVETTIEGYLELYDAYEIPEPDEIFAVGYDLAHGYGQSKGQVRAGLETASPRVMSRLREGADEAVVDFLSADRLERSPLGKRFAAWARGALSPELADLAELEAALAHPLPADSEALALGGAGAVDAFRLDASVVLLELEYDALEDPAGPLEKLSEPLRLACRSTGDGEVDLAELEPPVFEALRILAASGKALPERELAVNQETLESLRAHGLLVPERWSVRKGAAL
jgi:hypothetical protein